MPAACILVASRLSQVAMAHDTVNFPSRALKGEFGPLSGEQEKKSPPAPSMSSGTVAELTFPCKSVSASYSGDTLYFFCIGNAFVF